MVTGNAIAIRQASKRLGHQTMRFETAPAVVASASVVGLREGQGPLGRYFETILEDERYGERCWEQAESRILKEAVNTALGLAGWKEDELDALISGDLLNQISASNFASRNTQMPFLGIFSACATIAEGLLLAATLLEAGVAARVIAAASSHHEAAERQFRYPNEFGAQRPMTAQWTATAAGAIALGLPADGGGGAGWGAAADGSTGEAQLLPRITFATVGKVVEMGQKDPYDMGTAEVPAAWDTLLAHFRETGRDPAYYDLILTGDLARIGSEIFREGMRRRGLDVSSRHMDCGVLLYRPEQDVHAGGSGAGCAASVLASYILKEMRKGRFRRVLFVGTGSLHNPVSIQQGEPIPTIAHAVAIEA
ncbi:MAG: stage V sporulation protein AD [Limnochordales bacterium]|nr:stage V sporulation protein AD [Limnochordales bacterium]